METARYHPVHSRYRAFIHGSRSLRDGDGTRPWAVKDLQRRGFKLIEWDGETPTALVDKNGRLIVLLAGRPRNDPTWLRDVEDAASSLASVEKEFRRRGEGFYHRRGRYVYLGTGVSFGGGQTFPSNLQNPVWKQNLINKLVNRQSWRRTAGFGNGEHALRPN